MSLIKSCSKLPNKEKNCVLLGEKVTRIVWKVAKFSNTVRTFIFKSVEDPFSDPQSSFLLSFAGLVEADVPWPYQTDVRPAHLWHLKQQRLRVSYGCLNTWLLMQCVWEMRSAVRPWPLRASDTCVIHAWGKSCLTDRTSAELSHTRVWRKPCASKDRFSSYYTAKNFFYFFR